MFVLEHALCGQLLLAPLNLRPSHALVVCYMNSTKLLKVLKSCSVLLFSSSLAVNLLPPPKAGMKTPAVIASGGYADVRK